MQQEVDTNESKPSNATKNESGKASSASNRGKTASTSSASKGSSSSTDVPQKVIPFIYS